MVHRYRQWAEDRNRRELAGGFGGDLSQIGGVGKGRGRYAAGTRQEKLQAVSDRFYRGDIAEALEAWYIEKGGFLRKADLAAHKTPVVDPLTTTYRGFTVYKAGALTQGPYLLQTLRLLESFDLKKMGFNSADYIHTVIEAEKLALADRDEYYGDRHFVTVPMPQLLSDQYTKMRRELIDPKKASRELRATRTRWNRPSRPPLLARGMVERQSCV